MSYDPTTMITPQKIEDEVSTWENVKTRPEPAPIDHESDKYVGKFYRSPNWTSEHPRFRIYYCESVVDSGLWMAEVDPETFREFVGRRVTNVSRNAIGRTYHRLSPDLRVIDPDSRVDIVKSGL